MPSRRGNKKQDVVVVSIRLNLDDPEERKAYDYIMKMESLNVDKRTLIVRALNAFDAGKTDVQFMSDAAQNLQATLEEFQSAIQDMIANGVTVKDSSTGKDVSSDDATKQIADAVIRRRSKMM